MSVVVDTSVWSMALRRHAPVESNEKSRLVRLLKDGQPIVLLGVIVQELLQGIRSGRDFARVRDHLDAFEMLILEREDYIAAAELRNVCASGGVSASTIDFQIAAACIRHDHILLTADLDFRHIARCSVLQLL